MQLYHLTAQSAPDQNIAWHAGSYMQPPSRPQGSGPSPQHPMGVSPQHQMQGSPHRQAQGRQPPRDRTGSIMRPQLTGTSGHVALAVDFASIDTRFLCLLVRYRVHVKLYLTSSSLTLSNIETHNGSFCYTRADNLPCPYSLLQQHTCIHWPCSIHHNHKLCDQSLLAAR